ncbi:ANTAR domain-containing protein [Streptomyces sp. NPDC048362]|uniref:ANTAR domain-containing protein n=1 Tax=Streptomyces sp. NPDC048362 TaxID=3365539 RepID=UPI003717EE22
MIESEEQADPLRALREEMAQLRRAVASHSLVDRAIGVVVAVGGLSPEQGWEALRHVSQHTNVKLREVADLLVRWPAGDPLPEAIRRALPVAVRHVRENVSDVPENEPEARRHGPGRPGAQPPAPGLTVGARP